MCKIIKQSLKEDIAKHIWLHNQYYCTCGHMFLFTSYHRTVAVKCPLYSKGPAVILHIPGLETNIKIYILNYYMWNYFIKKVWVISFSKLL